MHKSVLLNEAITALNVVSDGIYIDGTFGRGGHSLEILQRLSSNGRLYAIDKDEEAEKSAEKNFGMDPRFKFFKGSYSRIDELAKIYNIQGKVNGILLDLGVSSPQLDDPKRGFSFTNSGPLDMRMDRSQALTAAMVVNQKSASDLAHIFKEYGEERYSKRISDAIVQKRKEQAISSTLELAQIVKEAHPRWEKHKHPATRVFQALRIYINQELDDLKTCLNHSMRVLAPKGRIVVISFHSLEDRIVKKFFKEQEVGVKLPKHIPIELPQNPAKFKRIGKTIKASSEELLQNIRSRSAILRVGEKVA